MTDEKKQHTEEELEPDDGIAAAKLKAKRITEVDDSIAGVEHQSLHMNKKERAELKKQLQASKAALED